MQHAALEGGRCEQYAPQVHLRLGFVIDCLQRGQKGAVDALLNAALPQDRVLHAVVCALNVNEPDVDVLVLERGTHGFKQGEYLLGWSALSLEPALCPRQTVGLGKVRVETFEHD